MATKTNRSRNNAIVTSANRIICRETPIQLTDEKMKNTLSQIYEKARKDADKFKLYKYYNVFLSIGSTLLLTLLTADFKTIGKLKGTTITKYGWIAVGLCFLAGIILAIVNVSCHHDKENDERDKAIQNAMSDLIQREQDTER